MTDQTTEKVSAYPDGTLVVTPDEIAEFGERLTSILCSVYTNRDKGAGLSIQPMIDALRSLANQPEPTLPVTIVRDGEGRDWWNGSKAEAWYRFGGSERRPWGQIPRPVRIVHDGYDQRSRDDDRSAGRWCAECGQHGSHHTDKHAEFQRSRDDTTKGDNA